MWGNPGLLKDTKLQGGFHVFLAPITAGFHGRTHTQSAYIACLSRFLWDPTILPYSLPCQRLLASPIHRTYSYGGGRLRQIRHKPLRPAAHRSTSFLLGVRQAKVGTTGRCGRSAVIAASCSANLQSGVLRIDTTVRAAIQKDMYEDCSTGQPLQNFTVPLRKLRRRRKGSFNARAATCYTLRRGDMKMSPVSYQALSGVFKSLVDYLFGLFGPAGSLVRRVHVNMQMRMTAR
jgi:hypothetical protein